MMSLNIDVEFVYSDLTVKIQVKIEWKLDSVLLVFKQFHLLVLGFYVAD